MDLIDAGYTWKLVEDINGIYIEDPIRGPIAHFSKIPEAKSIAQLFLKAPRMLELLSELEEIWDFNYVENRMRDIKETLTAIREGGGNEHSERSSTRIQES